MIHMSREYYRAAICTGRIQSHYRKLYPNVEYPAMWSKKGRKLCQDFIKQKVTPFRKANRHLTRDCTSKKQAEANLKKLKAAVPPSWRKFCRVEEFFYMGL